MNKTWFPKSEYWLFQSFCRMETYYTLWGSTTMTCKRVYICDKIEEILSEYTEETEEGIIIDIPRIKDAILELIESLNPKSISPNEHT